MKTVRKVSCKHCGEKWGSWRGTISNFYAHHARLHNLENLTRNEGESDRAYFDRLFKWRDEHFEDNLTIDKMLIHDKD